MTFTPINVVNGTTPANATWGNNAQTQYTEAILSFGPDAFAAGFVVSGLTAVKDVVNANQLNLQAGTAYLLQSDGTTRQRAVVAQSFTTSVVSTTYFLDINPDGTLSFGTSHSGVTNHLTILSVTTDASANISAITDARPLTSSLFSGMAGVSTLNLPGPLGVVRTQTNWLRATVNGTVTFGQVGALTGGGDPNGAALFGGAGNYLTALPDFFPTGNASWSLECLVKITGNPGATAVALFIGTAALKTCGRLLLNTSSQVMADVFGSPTGNSAALTINAWHHLVATWDGTTLRCYVDNVQTTTSTPGALSLAYGQVGIASDLVSGTWTDPFVGQIDEVAMYNVALSSARVAAHFSAITGGGYASAVETDSPLRYYRLGDPVGAAFAQDTVSPTPTTLVDAGGGVASVGGQTTAGPLGVPAVVAQAIAVPVTVTTNQNILVYTPTASGVYRASLYALTRNGTSGTATAQVNYTDADTGHAESTILSTSALSSGGAAAILNGAVLGAANAVPAHPILFRHQAGAAITAQWQDSTGTPNDLVTVIIERLA